jgi:hypothetical protein
MEQELVLMASTRQRSSVVLQGCGTDSLSQPDSGAQIATPLEESSNQTRSPPSTGCTSWYLSPCGWLGRPIEVDSSELIISSKIEFCVLMTVNEVRS